MGAEQLRPGDSGDPEVVAAPHCELGCAATALSRHDVDLVRDAVGAEWSLEVATRRLTTVPQPFLDRADIVFCAQGRGWRDSTAEITGITVRDQIVDRIDYVQEIVRALARGGVVLLVDDSAVPWLTHSAWSHGLLPHALAVWADYPARREMRVIEGHAWWQGIYPMSYDEILAAAFPGEDVHGIAGRFLSFDVAGAVPAGERLRRAARRLHATARRPGADTGPTEVTRWGTFGVAAGSAAVELAVTAFGGLRYVCRLAERSDRSPDMVRDLEFGRYTFERLAEELAFAAFSRSATGRLLREGLRATDEQCAPVDEVAGAWRTLWRAGHALSVAPSVGQLDDVVRQWRTVADTDHAVAVHVADVVEASGLLY